MTITRPGSANIERAIAGLALMMSVAAIAAGCTGRDSAAATRQSIAVTVKTVSTEARSRAGVYTASFEPAEQVAVAFQVGGYVDSITQVRGADGRMRDLQGGDWVKAHQLLARIKPEVYEAQANQYASAMAGAEAELAHAKKDYERDSELMKQQVIARATYDATLQRMQTAQSELDQQQAALERARINVGYCQLTSPIDGVVIDRKIETGSLVAPNTVAFVVAEITDMKAVFGVSDMLVARLKQGQPQSLTCEALPGVILDGTISQIAPNADPTTRVFDVEVTVPNRDAKIRTGMIASLLLDTAGQAPALSMTLPLDAIVRPPHDDKDFAVYVVQDSNGRSIAHLRKVELGDIVGNEIVVSAGVRPGDRVILRGATMVSEGDEVKVIP
ncbi:MAG TPA: efflux RND transporter periplasmic adaptor subunit [Candidatus Binataceae bacterium]|nr:efflux RND transporter periplasmic adaptor subunit [Candidatus Binataceae bacterium]